VLLYITYLAPSIGLISPERLVADVDGGEVAVVLALCGWTDDATRSSKWDD
jgi:hypothetical protein